MHYKDSTGLASEEEKLSRDIGAFEQKLNASDTNLSNAKDDLLRHVEEYNDASTRATQYTIKDQTLDYELTSALWQEGIDRGA